jgi:hypothetical protein
VTDDEALGLQVTFRVPRDGLGDKQQVLILAADDTLLETDHANLPSIKSREMLLDRLTAALGLSPEASKHLAEQVKAKWLEYYTEYLEAARAGPAQVSAAELLEEMPADVRRAAEEWLQQKDLLRAVNEDVRAAGVAGEEGLSRGLYVTGVSRLLPRPLSARIHGPSASGKSYIIDSTSYLFPPEAVLRATSLTSQALYYMPPGSLRHRWVVAGERSRKEDDDTADASRALREMQASGRLYKWLPIKIGGEIRTVLIEQEGPIAFSESTTRDRVFNEDDNRAVAFATDETTEQTARVIRAAAEVYAGRHKGGAAESVVARHWAIQRMLAAVTVPVVVPFAPALAALLPYDSIEMRRGGPQLFTTVQAVALLHQYQRGRDTEGRLEATVEDYAAARELLTSPITRLLGGGVSEAAARFLKRLQKHFKDETFSSAEAKRKEKVARGSVYGWLAALHDAGFLTQVTPSRGNSPAWWQITPGAAARPGAATAVLPSVEAVKAAWGRMGATKSEEDPFSVL